jgi:hypothetical protein
MFGRVKNVGELLRLGSHMRRDLITLAAETDATLRHAGFTEALDAMSRFWAYSPFNRYLIHQQRPRATRVASRTTWMRLGRRLKSGVRSITILAPMNQGNPPFVAVPVYDIMQTKGRRIPALPNMLLHGRSRFASVLEKAAVRLGLNIESLSSDRQALGESVGGTIRIRSGLSGRERAHTLAHEIAHELLHDMHSRGTTTHAVLETEADATSYVVMRALGLPSHAPAYIAWQGGSGSVVLRSMKRIQRAARRILRECELAGNPVRRNTNTAI